MVMTIMRSTPIKYVYRGGVSGMQYHGTDWLAAYFPTYTLNGIGTTIAVLNSRFSFDEIKREIRKFKPKLDNAENREFNVLSEIERLVSREQWETPNAEKGDICYIREKLRADSINPHI